jgi:hypothetical protein
MFHCKCILHQTSARLNNARKEMLIDPLYMPGPIMKIRVSTLVLCAKVAMLSCKSHAFVAIVPPTPNSPYAEGSDPFI